MKKRRLLVDFDGVLNNYTGWNNGILPNAKEGALEFLDELNTYYDIYIFTVRKPNSVKVWLKKYGFEKYIKEVTNKKIPAYAYIYDRGINFDGDFNEIQ